MTVVIGREGGPTAGPTARLGACRALDGSAGAPLHLDVDRPHAVNVVGKRGSGKSYTLGVLAEELARRAGVTPVVVDPMGVFGSLRASAEGAPVPATVVDAPAVPASALSPRAWCALVDLPPESGPGALVWQAAEAADSLAGMQAALEGVEAPAATRRAARNHLSLVGSWDVVADGGGTAPLSTPGVTVLDCSGLPRAGANAVVRGVAETLYRRRVAGDCPRLPWLVI